MSNTTDPISVENPPQDCVKFWDDELTKVSNTLKLEEAKTNRAKKALDNANSWASLLEAYWKNINNTNKLGKEASLEVSRFKERLNGGSDQNGICEYTECTVKVTKALYCLVEDFYTQTDMLKNKLAALITRIDCLNNPEINPRSSKIYACLKELSSKLDAAIASQKETIRKVLDVVKTATILDQTVCSEEYGLEDKLEDIYCLFNTPPDSSSSSSSSSTNPPQRPRGAYGRGCEQEVVDSCNAVIDPAPVMPLDQGDEDSYYYKTKNQAITAENEKQQAEENYEGLRKNRDSLRSSKKSLENAKQAAESAKGCK